MRLLPWDYAVRNLGRSRFRAGLAVLGSGMVVLLVLAAAAFVRGMERSLANSGDPRNVILLGTGSEESVERSEVSASAAGVAAASLPVRKQLGVPYVSPEVHHAALVYTDEAQTEGHMSMLRGVTDRALLVHREVRITSGRMPRSGELMVGPLAATRMGLPEDRLQVGRRLWFDGREWTIAGRFEAPATVIEAELWVPLAELQVATRRESGLSCVVVTMADDAELADVELFCQTRLDLELTAITEKAYYAKLDAFYAPIKAMVWVTALLIGLGGLFGGLNTLYAAFSARVRELGALQAIGYGRVALVISLLQESVLAATTGSLIAAGLGVAWLDGVAVRVSMGAVGLRVDGEVLALGLSAGLALGVIGALPPAWRCLRLPISDALRAA